MRLFPVNPAVEQGASSAAGASDVRRTAALQVVRGSLFRGGNAVDDVEVRPSHGNDEVDDDGDAYLAKRQKTTTSVKHGFSSPWMSCLGSERQS